uniref:Uncharacterized protein n=1 Tax=Oryza glumipatula TaxID=40148 RepID=A0A0E0BJX9_9ORYZ
MEIEDKFDMLLRMLEEFERKRGKADQRRRADFQSLKAAVESWMPEVQKNAEELQISVGDCHAQKFPNGIPSRMCIKIPVQDQPGYTNDNVDIQIHVLQTS